MHEAVAVRKIWHPGEPSIPQKLVYGELGGRGWESVGAIHGHKVAATCCMMSAMQKKSEISSYTLLHTTI
jgi:hypothetical protein